MYIKSCIYFFNLMVQMTINVEEIFSLIKYVFVDIGANKNV